MCNIVGVNPILASPLARKQLLYSFLTVYSINPKSDTTFQAAGAVVVSYENEITTLKNLAARILGKYSSMRLDQFAQNVAIEVNALCKYLNEHEAAALKTITFFESYHKAAYA